MTGKSFSKFMYVFYWILAGLGIFFLIYATFFLGIKNEIPLKLVPIVSCLFIIICLGLSFNEETKLRIYKLDKRIEELEKVKT
jgi:FtsH-binding integral membrane protein